MPPLGINVVSFVGSKELERGRRRTLEERLIIETAGKWPFAPNRFSRLLRIFGLERSLNKLFRDLFAGDLNEARTGGIPVCRANSHDGTRCGDQQHNRCENPVGVPSDHSHNDRPELRFSQIAMPAVNDNRFEFN